MTPPAPADPAHRNVAAHDCEICCAPARVLCVPGCKASVGVEFITLEGGYLDALVCVPGCRNRCDLGGFYPVLANGESDTAVCGEQWVADGELVGCGDCGRVFSQLTVLADGERVQVLHRLDTPPTGLQEAGGGRGRVGRGGAVGVPARGGPG